MKPALLVTRWVALLLFATWFGGFTFYAAVVVPIVSDVMGKVEAGSLVTREVTVTLNGIGVATLAAWWTLLLLERGEGGRWPSRLRVLCLVVNSATLAWLYVLHDTLSRQLVTAEMGGFYARHEFYLILSTVQWAASLVLLAASVWIWGGGAGTPSPLEATASVEGP